MRSLLVSILAISPALTACGESLYRLELFYEDEVVEAPTRRVTVRAIGNQTSCSPALSRVFAEPDFGEEIVAEFDNDYPPNPEETLLSALPLDQPLALEVAGFDGTDNLISRGCSTARLTEDGPEAVRVELRALPKCDDVPWTSLDVMLAMDTSIQTALADSDKAHFAGIRDHILKQPNLPLSTQFSIISFGEKKGSCERSSPPRRTPPRRSAPWTRSTTYTPAPRSSSTVWCSAPPSFEPARSADVTR